MSWFDALGGYRPDGGLMRDPTGLKSGFRPGPRCEAPRPLVCVDSAGRIFIVKGDDCVCLSPEALRETLRRLGVG